VITADFVTIDLGGFSINGGPASAAAVLAQGQLQGIVVRNGSISGYLTSVALGSADGSIVEGLRVRGFQIAPGTGLIASGIVKGNTVGGFGTGISATGTVTGNYAVENGTGIKIGQGSTVIGNTATNNTQFGIVADCPSNLTDNTAVNNGTNLVLNGDGCHSEDNVAP
jgi:hypothetical protein